MRILLTAIHDEAEHVKTFWFEPERPVDYIAGQFAEITLPHMHIDKRGDKRWFTLSSQPLQPQIAITTRFSQSGRSSSFKRALAALPVGSQLHLGDPMGDFVLPLDTSIPLMFVAGGIGITPFLSMAGWLRAKRQIRPIHLIYGVHDEASILTEFNEHTELTKRWPNEIPLTVIAKQPSAQWRGLNGGLSAKLILERSKLLAGLNDTKYYLSGSEAVVGRIASELQDLGVATQQIIRDTFLGY